ncbi:MAG: PEP-utilizing enzyme [Desulfobacteraceae bacterium]|nr:PEP-utilizing enzyme [Desulfobacteraceae bacterium]
MAINDWWRGLLSALPLIRRFTDQRQLSVGEVFACFQRLLAANNRAMEIIADLGEKLSGDYIFDRRYLEASAEALTQAVADSILALEQLTLVPFPELKQIHARLALQLNDLLAGGERLAGPPVIHLREAGLAHVAVVGGKCAHLAELIRRGFAPEVPGGFVITTRAFHELIDANGLRPKLAELEGRLADPGSPLAQITSLGEELARRLGAAVPPEGLLAAIEEAIGREMPTGGRLAVRSSALEEDLDFSFAGQFSTVLNVPVGAAAVFAAYLKVAASLFAAPALGYRRLVFPGEGRLSIAAGCQPMIDSRASGLVFTEDVAGASDERMVIVGAWGQGEAVVEGAVATDSFQVGKGEPPVILARQVPVKPTARYPDPEGGLSERRLEPELSGAACLNDKQILALARLARRVERVFRRPQDIEWALDAAGRFFILQARPLFVPEAAGDRRAAAEAVAGLKPLLTGGRVASLGVGAGPARRVLIPEDLAAFPEGAVLVARRDSALFSSVLGQVAAIVTEIGTPLSHMATICRELRVPCLVNVPRLLETVADGEEITVDAESGCIYQGRIKELLALKVSEGMDINASAEFRLLRRLLRASSQLNLVDPLLGEFRVEDCQSYHDILRFTHETAVQTLVDMGRDEGRLLGGHLARRLALPIPTGILVIDIGGGLTPEAPDDQVPPEAVASTPFAAILRGMLCPGAWHHDPMPVGMRDLMHSLFSPAHHEPVGRQYTGHNIAIIGAHYVNLCFRLGYHFNLIDAHCDQVAQNNHLYFRFLGGVTDVLKRSRRAAMIGAILRALEFNVKIRGDLVTARLAHLPVAEMERVLDLLGRLVGFTRQLDVRMDSDQMAEEYAQAFLNGDYGIVNR